jgi:hypothetical protein
MEKAAGVETSGVPERAPRHSRICCSITAFAAASANFFGNRR